MIASTLRRFEGFAPASPARLRREVIDREIARDRAATGLGITLRGLSKSFDGGKPVIDGLDLHIPAGQFVAVVGRSGCGKSTLLRLILGLEAPTAGRVAIEGGEAPRRIMFQEPRLLPWARVRDNVAVGLGRDGKAAERRERAGAALTE
ncbi:aliphatic sulfonate ABC transporter ATP-binding protein, partial [Methylobacterium frigidaeris]